MPSPLLHQVPLAQVRSDTFGRLIFQTMGICWHLINLDLCHPPHIFLSGLLVPSARHWIMGINVKDSSMSEQV